MKESGTLSYNSNSIRIIFFLLHVFTAQTATALSSTLPKGSQNLISQTIGSIERDSFPYEINVFKEQIISDKEAIARFDSLKVLFSSIFNNNGQIINRDENGKYELRFLERDFGDSIDIIIDNSFCNSISVTYDQPRSEFHATVNYLIRCDESKGLVFQITIDLMSNEESFAEEAQESFNKIFKNTTVFDLFFQGAGDSFYIAPLHFYLEGLKSKIRKLSDK